MLSFHRLVSRGRPRVAAAVTMLLLCACSYDPFYPDLGQGALASTKPVVSPLAGLPIGDVVLHEAGDGFDARYLKRVAGSASADAPLDLCGNLPTHKDRVPVKPVARPPFMKYYKDPAFGSKVIRITDSRVGEVHKPAYSTVQAWNADESLLLIYKSGGSDAGHLLLDGHTYAPVGRVDIVPSDIEEVFWSHTDPDVLFYVSKYSRDYGQFKRYNVRSGKDEKIRAFDDICGARGLPTMGNDVQMQSLDDDLWGFRCQTGEKQWSMFSYRISTGELVSKPLGDKTPWQPWTAPMPAPSGKRFWMQGAVLATDLETVERRLDLAKSDEHSNIGLTHDGKDALYQTAFDDSPDDCNGDLWRGVGHLVEHNLETGECRPIINEDQGYPYTTSGTHVSAQAYRAPGWVAMSSIGYDQFEWFTNGRKAPLLFSEIYLVNTDPSNYKVCRLAQHRSYAKYAKNASYHPYLGEPHATISPSGTRVIFGSDWYDSGLVDAYVIELPGYQRPAGR